MPPPNNETCGPLGLLVSPGEFPRAPRHRGIV
nr:MAG TPA: hypothetical protein [Caudoviricetes sp.]